MNIKETLENYIEKGEFFSPDYERDNEILKDFKENNPTLDQEQINELVMILKDFNNEWKTKYFVADLLYYYDKFGHDLMEPMLNLAINYKDPSFNRIFLRPCLRSFGDSEVIQWLIEKINNSTIEEKKGIANLLYWLNISGADTTELHALTTKQIK